MQKESIITINRTKENSDLNWALKRYLPGFKDGQKTITGIYFPWEQLFENKENITEISEKITQLFNEYAANHSFGSIHYQPQHRDVFLCRIDVFSSYYWIEFIYTKNQWNLKTKNYQWEDESFILSHGTSDDQDFIGTQIGYKILFYSFEHRPTDENGYRKRKYSLPVYINKESLFNSNYQFCFSKNDGLRRDHRVRSINLLVDEDFDYFLQVDSNEYSEATGRELNFIIQGQLPKKILFPLLEVIHKNKSHQNYGYSITDIPTSNFTFKINGKFYQSSILFYTGEEEDPDFSNLETLETAIIEWVDKIVELQKEGLS